MIYYFEIYYRLHLLVDIMLQLLYSCTHSLNSARWWITSQILA